MLFVTNLCNVKWWQCIVWVWQIGGSYKNWVLPAALLLQTRWWRLRVIAILLWKAATTWSNQILHAAISQVQAFGGATPQHQTHQGNGAHLFASQHSHHNRHTSGQLTSYFYSTINLTSHNGETIQHNANSGSSSLTIDVKQAVLRSPLQAANAQSSHMD